MSEPPPQRRDQQEERERRGWYQMTALGMEFVVAILLFGGLGWWLDGKAGTTPWLTITGFLFGFAVGLWILLRAAGKAFKD